MGCRKPDHAYRTVTKKLALPTLFAASVAVQTTRVEPSGNVLPERCEHVGTSTPSTSSTAVAPNVTTAPVGLVASTTRSCGTVTTGGVLSGRTTSNVAVAVL